MRDYKILVFNMILGFSNELEIDPAEIMYEYQFTDEEMKEFYEWANDFIN